MLDSRPYKRELTLVMIAYALLLALTMYLLIALRLPQPLRIAVSLLPMVPGCTIVWVVLRELRRMDELERRIVLESLAFSFAGTAVVTLGWGFLELVGVRHLPAFAVWPIMGALWLIGQSLARRRYR